MMEDKRLADYFVVSGLPANPELLEEVADDQHLNSIQRQDPIVEVVVINKTLGEFPPHNFKCIEFTPNGLIADLNHGSIRAHEMYICYRRGRDKPPLVDIG